MFKLYILLLLSSILSSCATDSLNSRLKDGEISIGPLLDLSRSSYLKGCTENSKLPFVQCVDKAKLHEKDIEKILLQ